MLELLQWLRFAIHTMSWNNERICFKETETWKYHSCILTVQIFSLELCCVQWLFLRNKFFSQLCCMIVVATCLRCEVFKKALSISKTTDFWGLGMCFFFAFWYTEATRCLVPQERDWNLAVLPASEIVCVCSTISSLQADWNKTESQVLYWWPCSTKIGGVTLFSYCKDLPPCSPAYQQLTASRKPMHIFAQVQIYPSFE